MVAGVAAGEVVDLQLTRYDWLIAGQSQLSIRLVNYDDVSRDSHDFRNTNFNLRGTVNVGGAFGFRSTGARFVFTRRVQVALHPKPFISTCSMLVSDGSAQCSTSTFTGTVRTTALPTTMSTFCNHTSTDSDKTITYLNPDSTHAAETQSTSSSLKPKPATVRPTPVPTSVEAYKKLPPLLQPSVHMVSNFCRYAKTPLNYS